MIIFGSRGVTSTKKTGHFHCPSCSSQQNYHWKEARRFFTLYFIPLIPLDRLGEYVECQRCKNTYKEQVLSFDPRSAERQARVQLDQTLKRILVLMMMADGKVEESEVAVVRKIYSSVMRKELTEADVRREAEQVRNAQLETATYAKSVAGHLTDEGKELLLRAALMVVAADGHFDEQEKKQVAMLASALGMTSAHVQGVLSELSRKS